MVEKFYARFAAPLAGKRATFALYAPMPFEPDLLELAQRLQLEGHRVVLPEVIEGAGIVFEGLPPDQIDVLAVPGRLFGEHGERIGRGRGDFDRYLSGCKPGRPLRVALAFELQMRPTLPQNPWDQRVDWIVTEKREIKAGA